MHTFHAIVEGIVQGLTEFLPISSTAHLRLVPAFAGWEDPGAAFTAVVQLGTMAAVLLYFRRDLWNITRGLLAGLRDPAARGTLEWRLGLYIILGTIPIGIIGLILKHRIEHQFRTLELIGAALIVAGLVLAWSEIAGRKERKVEDLTARDAAVIGLAQAAALIPGVSRSGATISAGFFLGLDRVAAARYSFLLSVPAVVLSGLFELKDVGDGGGYGAGPTIIATILAFVVGYASIAWLLRYITNNSFAVFVGYRLILGAGVIILAAAGTIS
ncbi:MAG: undecaprenyl-diphosphate phosphatase [Solirubrobacteraceae bacterium]